MGLKPLVSKNTFYIHRRELTGTAQDLYSDMLAQPEWNG